jgi:hypothetical protein
MRGLRVVGVAAAFAVGVMGVAVGKAGASSGGGSGPVQCPTCLSVPATIYGVDGDGDHLVEVNIPVERPVASLAVVRVRYDTRSGTAQAPGDFVAVDDGVARIAAGATVGYARVLVRRHSLCQLGKHFDVVFSSPSVGRFDNPVSRVELRAPSCGARG